MAPGGCSEEAGLWWVSAVQGVGVAGGWGEEKTRSRVAETLCPRWRDG